MTHETESCENAIFPKITDELKLALRCIEQLKSEIYRLRLAMALLQHKRQRGRPKKSMTETALPVSANQSPEKRKKRNIDEDIQLLSGIEKFIDGHRERTGERIKRSRAIDLLLKNTHFSNPQHRTQARKEKKTLQNRLSEAAKHLKQLAEK